MSQRSTLSRMVRLGAMAILVLGTLLAILGGRWALIEQFGTDGIEWDQWDAEGIFGLVPWLRQGDFWSAVFHPHNEHRVVLTKLVNITTTMLNGHWDQRLEAVLNSFYPGLLSAVTLIWVMQRYSARASLVLFAALAVGFGGPLAWQNVFGGFHSQQFFLILTAVFALGILPFAVVGSLVWWGGILAAVVGLGTMGSGFIASAGVVGLILLRTLVHQASWRPYWPTLALCTALTLVGWVTRVEVPYHATLKATHFGDFWASLRHSLTWPAPSPIAPYLLLWAPWLALLVQWARRREDPYSETNLVVLGLGGWVLVQLVATAWMRGAGGGEPASRYIDTLVFGAISNLVALIALTCSATSRRERWSWVVLLLLWATVYGQGAARRTNSIIRDELASLIPYRKECEVTSRGYLYTRDRVLLKRARVPFPDAEGYQAHLDIPEVPARMPASIRRPITEWEAAVDGPFRTLQLAARNEYLSASIDSAGRSGLPDGLPNWGAEKIWSSFGVNTTGDFRSVPVYLKSGSLRLDVAGTWSDAKVSLQVRHARTQEVLVEIRPESSSIQAWQPVYFDAPAGPFVLVAKDESDSGWIAFSGLREEARGSRLARLASENGLRILWVGLGMGLSSALVLLVWPPALLPRKSSAP